jgi:hypothetical protein
LAVVAIAHGLPLRVRSIALVLRLLGLMGDGVNQLSQGPDNRHAPIVSPVADLNNDKDQTQEFHP